MQRQITKEHPNPQSKIKHLIGVISGKGGVGKSFSTTMLALSLQKQGYQVGILDADITGPSIPHMFQIKQKAYGDETSIYPQVVEGLGIKIISAAMLLDDNKDPIVWRGPLISDLIKQFYSTVNWGELDYLLVDFPPGTSDVALTAMQSLPLDGLVIVTTPQVMVATIVKKAIKMAEMLNVPVYGVINNMAYLDCPHCRERIYLYGELSNEAIETNLGVPHLGDVKLNLDNVKLLDQGRYLEVELTDFMMIADKITKRGK